MASPDWVLACWIRLSVAFCSFAQSNVPSFCSICIWKPEALPMPWMGGGATTKAVPSCISLKPVAMMCSAIERTSCPLFLPRLSQSSRMTKPVPALASAVMLSRIDRPEICTTCFTPGVARAISDIFWSDAVVRPSEAPSGTFDQTEAYDPKTNVWISYKRMPTARHGLGAATRLLVHGVVDGATLIDASITGRNSVGAVAGARERRLDPRGHHRQPGPLGGPVGDVEQRRVSRHGCFRWHGQTVRIIPPAAVLPSC